MPTFDSTPLIVTLCGLVATLVGFIYVDNRSETKRKITDHEARLSALEKERLDFAILKTNVEYIRQAVDEMKTRQT